MARRKSYTYHSPFRCVISPDRLTLAMADHFYRMGYYVYMQDGEVWLEKYNEILEKY